MNLPINLSEDDILRFWKGVNIKSKNECWVWKRGAHPSGRYGTFIIKGRTIYSHRVAWVIANGRQIQDGYEVCHAPVICHNPLCCNPSHLSEKTPKENQHDREMDGTKSYGLKNGKYTHPESVRRGEKNGRAKLTWDAVQEIREIYRTNHSLKMLSEKFGVSKVSIQMIVNNQHWKIAR